MCLTFPGRVVEVGPFDAIVETEGRQRRASTMLLRDVAVGDWVAVGAGTIVARLDANEAAEITALVREAAALEAADLGMALTTEGAQEGG